MKGTTVFIKPDNDGDVVGGPDGTIEADERGAFFVSPETGAALLRRGGWTEVGPIVVEPEPEVDPEAEAKAAAEAAAKAAAEAAAKAKKPAAKTAAK